MKPSKPGKDNSNDKYLDILMRIVELQNRVIESLAVALGAMGEDKTDDDEDDDGKDGDNDK